MRDGEKYRAEKASAIAKMKAEGYELLDEAAGVRTSTLRFKRKFKAVVLGTRGTRIKPPVPERDKARAKRRPR